MINRIPWIITNGDSKVWNQRVRHLSVLSLIGMLCILGNPRQPFLKQVLLLSHYKPARPRGHYLGCIFWAPVKGGSLGQGEPFSIPKMAELTGSRAPPDQRLIDCGDLCGCDARMDSWAKRNGVAYCRWWKQWVPQESGTNGTLYAADFLTTDHGWVVGSRGVILHTEDGGESWADQVSGTTADLFGVHFLNEKRGWAVGALGVILATTDGGKSWGLQTTNNPATFFDIVFTDNVAGWAVGTQGAMFQTLNGGQVWVDHTRACGSPCIKPADLVKIQFFNSLVGRIVGERGTILETQDAGFTWQEIESISSETLYDSILS